MHLTLSIINNKNFVFFFENVSWKFVDKVKTILFLFEIQTLFHIICCNTWLFNEISLVNVDHINKKQKLVFTLNAELRLTDTWSSSYVICFEVEWLARTYFIATTTIHKMMPLNCCNNQWYCVFVWFLLFACCLCIGFAKIQQQNKTYTKNTTTGKALCLQT